MCSLDYVKPSAHKWRWWLLLGVILILPVLAACAQPTAQQPPLKVVATLAPLADWARHVGQERVSVTQLVPTGVDPQMYTLTEENRRALRDMDVLISNGLGLEPWLREAVQEAQPQDMESLELGQFIGTNNSRRAVVRSPEFAEGERAPGQREVVILPGTVPSAYLWLNPGAEMAQRGVLLISDTFARADPDHLLFYRGNAEQYNGDLENLDLQIRQRIRGWPRVEIGVRKRLAMQAPDLTWHYFARQYGIDLRETDALATIQPVLPQSTPLFTDAFISPAEQMAAVGLRQPDGVLNPLGADDYITLMRSNVEIMEQGLQRLAQAQPERKNSLLSIP